MHHAILAHAKEHHDVAHILATVDDLSRRHGVTLQLFDADAVYSARHLEAAIYHAERAFAQGANAARTLAAEILLYVSGERQVHRAIETAGIRHGLDRVVVLAIGHKGGAAIWDLLDRLGWQKSPRPLGENPRALERYGIHGLNGESEFALLERVALVDLQK